MELKPGLSAIVTGGASGIGKALSLALAERGIFVTIIDFSEEKGKQVVAYIEKQNAKFHEDLKFPSAMFIRCDVTDTGELSSAFAKHLATYGGLDICINSAGIATLVPFQKDQTDASGSWRRTLNVNLIAVVQSTLQAIQAMQASKKGGAIINVGSAAGLYPLYGDPAYSASKVHTLNHNFRAATRIMRTTLGMPIKRNHVLVKILYAGVNASDVNFSSGRYFTDKSRDTTGNLPFDAGFEAVGIIGAVGEGVDSLKVGTAAAVMTFGSYAEFMIVPSKFILPVARPDPEVVAMLTSGLTASIALEKAAHMGSGQTVLVTAAAGGTGQFAVQLAKLAGNKVVATCGGEDKAMLLKKLGVDRVINYKKEKIKDVLKKEFSKGVDIIYESVGGEMFDMCLNALAIYGRLVVIGMISQYQGEHGWKPANYPGLCEKLLAKSQTVAGFFLVQYSRLWQQHLDKLFNLYSSGNLKVNMDPRRFVGLQSVADAVEYLHSGKSIGKVVVCIDPSFSQVVAKL